MAITSLEKLMARRRASQEQQQDSNNNSIGMAQLPTEFPMTGTPLDNPPTGNPDLMTDILPSSSVQDMGTPLGVINDPYTSRLPIPQDILDRKTYGMTPSMPTNQGSFLNFLQDQGVNTDRPMYRQEPSVPMTPSMPIEMQSEPTPYSAVDESVNPLTEVQQSNNVKIPIAGSQPFVPIYREPPTEIVQSHPKPKIDKPKKSIYESLRERRAKKQTEPRKAPQSSQIKPASSPVRAMSRPSPMKDLAFKKMRADKQATDTAQSKTDSIQAAIKKLRSK